MKPVAVAALLMITSGASQACDLIKDPRPSWEQMIDESEVVFVGKVVAVVSAEPADGSRRAVFEVETPVRGDIGTEVKAVMDMNSCNLGFGIGDHVIFAGAPFATSDTQTVYMAEDTGWDPTVFLDDPPTADQVAQLNYVNKLAEEQAAKGADK